MGIEDYIVKGSEWSQGDYIKNLTPDVRGGYCRSLVIYWLSDVNIHHEITITRNFQSLIQGHTGNLKAIAKAQADTAKIGSLNGLNMVQVHLMSVSSGALSVNTLANSVFWPNSRGIGTPGDAVANALIQSTKSMCIVHLEWEGWFGTSLGDGAHAIGVISEPGGSTGPTYTIFDPNYGIMRAYGPMGIVALMLEIKKAYSVNKLMAMPVV